MYRKSQTQKRIENLSKLMTNGYKYGVIDEVGKIITTFRFKYEVTLKPLKRGHKIVLLKDLFDEECANNPN